MGQDEDFDLPIFCKKIGKLKHLSSPILHDIQSITSITSILSILSIE